MSNPAAAELLAKVIVLVAALLPVAAVAIRMIGFALDPYLRNILQLAVALPIVDLTALGAWELLAPATSFIFLVLIITALVRTESRLIVVLSQGEEVEADARRLGAEIEDIRTRWATVRETLDGPSGGTMADGFASEIAALEMRQADVNRRVAALADEREQAMPRWIRRVERSIGPIADRIIRMPRKVLIGVALAATALFAALAPYFPLAFIIIPASGLGQVLLTRSIRNAGDFRLRHAWPALAVFMAGYVIASGLTYSGSWPSTYHFLAIAELPDGSYAELGHTDDLVYLRPCADVSKGSVAVPRSAIRLIELPPPPPRQGKPSLLGVLLDHETLRLGSVGQCDYS